MAFIGIYETPSARLARLRSALSSTAQSMGDTVSQAVDLEARTRAMEDSLRRFREVEQRQQPARRTFEPSPSPSGIFTDRLTEQPQSIEQFQTRFPDEPVPGTVPQPTVGFERLTAEEQQTSFEGGFPANLTTPDRKAQHLWLRRAGQLTQEGLSVEEALDRAQAEVGPAIEKQFTPETRGGIAGRFERGLPKVIGGVGRGISAANEAARQVNNYINEQLGTPPEQQPRREDFNLLGGRLTEGQRETLGGIPVVGPAIEREAEFFSSAPGLAVTLAWPALILRGAVGGVALASGAGAVGAPEEAQIGAQVAGNILTPGAGVVPNLGRLTGGLKGPQATTYVTRLNEEITTARSAADVLRNAGLTSKADELERFAQVAEGSLARAEGRALVSEATGDVIGGAFTPTQADIGVLQTVRAATIGDITAPEFTQAAVRADVRATGETISSQVLQPRPQTGPAILQTQLPEGLKDVGQRLAVEQGGGTLAGIGDAKDFFGRAIDPLLPQGGIQGGFKARPRGMKPGAKVTGLTQEGEQVEGTLIQVSGEKAIIRDAAGNVRPVTAPELVEAAGGGGIRERLKDIGRDFRFGPSSRTAVPSLDPSVQKFVKVLRTAKPTQRTLKAERAEELGRRAARGRVPFEAEARTPEEALRGLRGAQRGKLPEPPEFEVRLPSGERGVAADAFTQEEVTNFINIARFSPTLDRELFTRGNIIESLIGSLDKKGILFGRLPTPGELKQLERVYGAEFARELQKVRPFGERFWRLTLDALNIPRSFLAAFDLSFPFRQGVFAFARHPKEFFGNLPAMLRAAKNPEFAEQMVAAIKNDRTLIETAEGFRPLNELMEDARLFLPDISGTEAFEARAEEFLSTLARRIPGVKFSERGFIAYGDKLRSDIFRNTLQSWARQSKPATAEEIADLGIMLNVLTGRGNLPPELAKSLSFGFFAPRFAASRPQLFLAATINNLPGARKVTGTILGAPGQTTRVARLASQELVTSVGAGLGILALVKMSGVGDVELNPLSSDFGKIKIGKTRIDFWGGARPWATVIARMITGKKKTATGFVVPEDTMKALERFGRSKLAPPAALIADVLYGETAVGEEIGTRGDILRRTLPLAIQDVADAVIQESTTVGLLSTAAFLGVGFQTYETPSEKKKRAFEEAFPDRTYQATPDDNRLVRGAIEEGNNKDALEDAFQPSPEQMKTEEVRVAQATELGLFTLAHGVEMMRGLSAEAILTGNNNAGPEFADVWVDYLDRVSGAIFEAVFGKEKRGSPEYLAWRDIKLQRDPDTREPLWDEFFAAKDAAFAKLDPRLQRALDVVDAPGDDPVLQRAVEDFNAARKQRRELFNIPRWTGISATEQKRIENVHDLVERKRTELAFQGFADVESGTIYQLVAKENGIADDLLAKAFSLRPGSNTASLQRNPEFDQALLTATDTLLPFFPDMFRRREIQRAIGSGAEVGESFIPLNSLAADPLAAESPQTQGSFIPLEALAAR